MTRTETHTQIQAGWKESFVKGLRVFHIALVHLFQIGGVLLLAAWIAGALYWDALDQGLPVLILAVLAVLGGLLKLSWTLLTVQCNTHKNFLESAKSKICLKYMSRVPWIAVLGMFIYVVVNVALVRPQQLIALVGLFTILLFCWGISTTPSKVHWRVVLSGLACQLILGLLILRWSAGYAACLWLADQFTGFLSFSEYGARAVFGEMYILHPFAMQVMPDLIWFNAVVCLLEHWGILTWVVGGVGAAIHWVMATSPVESVVAVGNILLGCNSAVLMVKPMVGELSTSELHCLMASGLATIGGGLFGFFTSIGVQTTHLVTASFMSAPAALAVSKLMVPEIESEPPSQKVQFENSGYQNSLGAFSQGAVACVPVIASILTTLIATLSILEFFNSTLNWFGHRVGLQDLSFELLCSYIFTPVAFLMGVEWADCHQVARLIGIKTILNEVFGFQELSVLIHNRINGVDPAISEQSEVIATYALCGFSNIGTVGSMAGFLAFLAPHRAGDVARMGLRSLIAGTAACLMTGTMAGLLYQG